MSKLQPHNWLASARPFLVVFVEVFVSGSVAEELVLWGQGRMRVRAMLVLVLVLVLFPVRVMVPGVA